MYDPSTKQEQKSGLTILAPKPVVTKGRPRKKRLTSATEHAGTRSKKMKLRNCDDLPEPSQVILPASADSDSFDTRRRRRCGNCGETGHYVSTCRSSRVLKENLTKDE
jgi:hypothetical protein